MLSSCGVWLLPANFNLQAEIEVVKLLNIGFLKPDTRFTKLQRTELSAILDTPIATLGDTFRSMRFEVADINTLTRQQINDACAATLFKWTLSLGLGWTIPPHDIKGSLVNAISSHLALDVLAVLDLVELSDDILAVLLASRSQPFVSKRAAIAFLSEAAVLRREALEAEATSILANATQVDPTFFPLQDHLEPRPSPKKKRKKQVHDVTFAGEPGVIDIGRTTKTADLGTGRDAFRVTLKPKLPSPPWAMSAEVVRSAELVDFLIEISSSSLKEGMLIANCSVLSSLDILQVHAGDLWTAGGTEALFSLPSGTAWGISAAGMTKFGLLSTDVSWPTNPVAVQPSAPFRVILPGAVNNGNSGASLPSSSSHLPSSLVASSWVDSLSLKKDIADAAVSSKMADRHAEIIPLLNLTRGGHERQVDMLLTPSHILAGAGVHMTVCTVVGNQLCLLPIFKSSNSVQLLLNFSFKPV